MKIVFTTKTNYSVADLIKMVATEDVGVDSNVNSWVRLYVPQEDGRLIRYEFDEASEPELHYGERQLYELGVATWVTAMGRYCYRLEIDLEEEGPQAWTYEGPERGFLSQDLLPPMTESIISSVQGTYGTFSGPNALGRYSAIKEGWCRFWTPILGGLQKAGVFPPTCSENRFFAQLWKLCKDEFSRSSGPKTLVFEPDTSRQACRAVLEAALASLDEAEAAERQVEVV